MSIRPWCGYDVQCDSCGEMLGVDGFQWSVFNTEKEAIDGAEAEEWSASGDVIKCADCVYDRIDGASA